MFVNKAFRDSSGNTINIGGNDIRSHVKSYLTGIHGSTFSDDAIDTIIREGRVQNGGEINIQEGIMVLDKAKLEFAHKLKSTIGEYLVNIRISPMEISTIVFSGGGSMASRYFDDTTNEEVETTRPMSEYVVHELRSIGMNANVFTHSEDPRTANIKGLFIVARRIQRMEENSITKLPS